MKLSLWLSAALFILVSIYTLLGFVVLPHLLKQQLPGVVHDATGGILSLGDTAFNPYTYRLEVQDLAFSDPEGVEMAGVGSLVVDLHPQRLLFGELVLQEFRLSGISAVLTQYRDGALSTDWLITTPQNAPAAEAPEPGQRVRAEIAEVAAEGVTVSLGRHLISIGSVHLAQPQLTLERLAAVTPKAETVAVPSDTNASESWAVDLERLELASGTVTLDDRTPKQPVTLQLEGLQITVEAISTVSGPLRYTLEGSVSPGGTLSASGSYDLASGVQEGRFALQQIPLTPAAPYLRDITHLELKSGAASLEGSTAFTPGEETSEITFEGAAALASLELLDTRDGTRLGALESLKVGTLSWKSTPAHLEVGSVDVTGLYSNVVMATDGTLNVASLVKTSDAAATSSETESADSNTSDTAVALSGVMIAKSRVDFTDRTLSEPFRTEITEIEGSLSGVDTKGAGISDLKMDAKVDAYGEVRLEGALNLADPKTFTELQMTLTNLAMRAYSPYTAKYVGRKIKKGRLDASLDYAIKTHQLDSKNNVKITKISLGDQVESKEAVSVPLDLAVALLEDRKEVIDVDLPVRGNLDDPTFDYGKTLWKTAFNLLTNVATSPFNLLGSLLGIDGEALQDVAFDPGLTKLSPSEREKLDQLGGALTKRPALVLQVAGRYDTGRDGAAMRRAAAEKLIAARSGVAAAATAPTRLLETLAAETADADAIRALRDTERAASADDAIFERRYRAALIGRIAEAQELADGALEALARQRAEAVVSYLGSTHTISPERVVLQAIEETTGSDKRIHCPLGIEATKG